MFQKAHLLMNRSKSCQVKKILSKTTNMIKLGDFRKCLLNCIPDVLDPAEAPSAGGENCREAVPRPLQGHNLSISLTLTKL